MSSAAEPPRDLPDRAIRQALRHPANLRAFLHQAVPALADGFDCDHCRLLDREFPLDDWRRREADLPFEIPYRIGHVELPALVYVLIEHQSAEDPAMPLRLLYFVVLYWERQWRAWEQHAAPKPPLRLSPVLPLVLYTGAGTWQNNRSLHDLLDEPAEFHGFVPDWAPLFWELGRQNPDELLNSGDAWQQMLATLQPGDDASVFDRMCAAMQRLAPVAAQDHARWYDLMRIVLAWALLRRPGLDREKLLTAAKAAQADVNRQKEVEIMGQTIGETIWEEGRLKGISEGISKGQLIATRTLLRQLLLDRFGTVSAAVLQRIENATDIDRLMAAAREASHLASPEDLQL